MLHGISATDFQRHFWPTCRAISNDNRLGRVIFAITREIQKRRFARLGLWRMVSSEQQIEGGLRRMSTVLWDTFTGSAAYGDIFRRALHPAFLGGFARQIVWGQDPRPVDEVRRAA